MTPDACRALSRYNTWMNDKVYAAAASLTDDERKRDRGAFFKSLHATLNHILVADTIWMGRFEGVEPEPGCIGAGGIKALDQDLHPDFEALRRARRALDERIAGFAATLTEARLAEDLRFVRKGVANASPLWWSVAQLFNHQTHHRGQATTLLSQAGRDPGATDLIAMLREEATRAKAR